MDGETRQQLGREVAQARLRRGWGKAEAARVAQVSAITWKRVEDGLTTQDAKLAQVLQAVGLDQPGRTSLHTAQDDGFDIPDDLDIGYADVAVFADAVRHHCPHLAGRAARLKVEAAELFAEAGRHLAAQGSKSRSDRTA